MFGELIRGFRKAGIAVEARNLLMKNYNFMADPDGLSRCAQEMGEFYNAHELAVFYLSGHVLMMDSDQPDAERIVTKYVRVAKQAYVVGAAKNKLAIAPLLEAAYNKFGIDSAAIVPSSY